MAENLEEGQGLSPEEERAQIAKQQQEELMRRREAGELASTGYKLDYICCHQEIDAPVTRKDVENHAIVINPDEFKDIGYIEFVGADGETIILDFTDEDFDKSHPLIIFPEELGEETSSE